MYPSILIGVQGDADDHRAIELARRLASTDSRLTLAHVSVIATVGREREGLELELDAPGGIRHAFADALSLCGGDTSIIREHAPSVGAGLSAAAERVGADLLVIGSTWHRGLDRLLAGDDVQSTVGRCGCAVAVADRETGPDAGAITRIGIAYDATPEADAAVEHARRLAESIRARLVPVHVAAPQIHTTRFGMVADPIEGAEAVVEAARARMGTVAGEEVRVIYGDPIWELAAFSERVDLLVCGSRRQTPLRRFVFGSTALAMSRQAHCPMIIVPGSPADDSDEPGRQPAAVAVGHTPSGG